MKRLPFCSITLLAIFLVVTLKSFCESSNKTLENLYLMIQRNPHDVSLWNAYGIELAKLGELQSAIQTWYRGLQIDPSYFHLYNNIGSALRRLGFLNEAVDWFKAGLKIKPTYWTFYNLGLLYEDLKKPQEALKAYQSALQLFPEFHQAKEHFLRLQREIASNDPHVAIETKPYVSAPVNFSNIPSPLSINKTKKSTQKKVSHSLDPYGNPQRKQAQTTEYKLSPPVKHPEDIGGPVFITFDGGADADGIPGILEALAARNVHSTFFLTGNFVENYPDLAIRILAEGHEIGNHSMNHKNMSGWTKEQIAEEIRKAEDVFQRVLGKPGIKYFRFPFGAQNSRVEGYVRELGYNPVYWNIDTLDWKEPSVASIVAKVRAKLKPYSVILMHCGSKAGAQALPYILDEVISRGYQPSPLSRYEPSKISAINR